MAETEYIAEIWTITASNITYYGNVGVEKSPFANQYAMLNIPSTAIFLAESVAEMRGVNLSAKEVADFTTILMDALRESYRLVLEIIKQDCEITVNLFEPATTTLSGETYYHNKFDTTDDDANYSAKFTALRTELQFNSWFAKFDDANENVEWAHSNIADRSSFDAQSYNDVANVVLQNSGYATETFFV